MYTEKNLLLYNELEQSKIFIIDKIINHFQPPQSGIAFIFESESYKNFKSNIWSSAANYLCLIDDEVEENSPKHLLDIMYSKKYGHIIWISKEICNSKDFKFSWVFSHELTHLFQKAQNHHIYILNSFIYRCIGHIFHIINELPLELDADLNAFKFLITQYGKPKVIKYIKNLIQNNYKPECLKLVLKNIDKDYNFVLETIKFFKKYYKLLSKTKKLSSNDFVRNFELSKYQNL